MKKFYTLKHPNGLYFNLRTRKLQEKVDKHCLITKEQSEDLLSELKNYKLIEYEK